MIVIESGIGGGKGELAGARLNAGEAESSSEGYGRSEGLQRMSGVVEGDRVAVYRPGPVYQQSPDITGINIPVSQAREEGGGSDAGFWLSVVGMYNLNTEFSGSPGNSWNSTRQLPIESMSTQDLLGAPSLRGLKTSSAHPPVFPPAVVELTFP